MRIALAVLVMLSPLLMHGQEWDVLGLPRGTGYGMVVASDTAMYYPNGHLYRQGADRKWRQQREIGPIRDIEAWGDTVMLLTPSAFEMSVDAGVTWRTADAKSFTLIMPGTDRVVKFGRTTDTTIGVTMCEPFRETCVETILPKETTSYQTYVSEGMIAIYYKRADRQMLSVLYAPSLDTTTWRREEREITSIPINVIGGAISYLQDTSVIYIWGGGEDTLHLRQSMITDVANYQLCRYDTGWILRTLIQTDTRLYRSEDGDHWSDVTELQERYYFWMSGVQGDELVFTNELAGPFRIDLNTGVVTRDVVGFGHRSEMFTDGRYVVVYDHERDRNLAILEDTPDGARLLFDTVLTSEITSAYLIGDSVWVVADSIYTVDLATLAWTNTRFPIAFNRYWGAGVSALPNGVGILCERSVYYREYGSTVWQRIDTNRSEHAVSEVFVGTDDGYMMIQSEGYDIDLEYLYAVRFTMSGELIGAKSLIGGDYSWGTWGQRGLRRVGDTYFFTINHRPGPHSTDVGSSWFEGSVAFDQGLTTSALWLYGSSHTGDGIAVFSDDLGATWSFMSVPNFTPYEIDQLFCLDHHCYAMGREGVMTTPRPTVSVQESSEKPQPRLVGESAVVYNVLGEAVATLPIIDGVLAPYEMSVLPMQPLWAVAGGVAIRIR